MSKQRQTIRQLQKQLADKDVEIEQLKAKIDAIRQLAFPKTTQPRTTDREWITSEDW